MREKATIMDARQIDRALSRIAHEVVERNHGTDELALVGIRSRGVPLAETLADKIRTFEGVDVPTGSVDITVGKRKIITYFIYPLIRAFDTSFREP